MKKLLFLLTTCILTLPNPLMADGKAEVTLVTDFKKYPKAKVTAWRITNTENPNLEGPLSYIFNRSARTQFLPSKEYNFVGQLTSNENKTYSCSFKISDPLEADKTYTITLVPADEDDRYCIVSLSSSKDQR